VRIHILQFDERVGLGTFSGWITALGGEITTWRCDQDQWPEKETHEPVILLGGYMGVADRERLPYLQKSVDWLVTQVARKRPLLAICLGSQLLAHALGGKVYSRQRQEKGIIKIGVTAAGQHDPLFCNIPNPLVSFAWHSDSFDLPPGAWHLAETEICSGQTFRYHNAWGVQFHPEVDEQVVADWCRRTDMGTEPLEEFCRQQQIYFSHSRKLLENFLSFAAVADQR